MDNQILKSEILTPDEKLVADFIQTRTKKVLADIQALSKAGVKDLNAWSECFLYLTKTYGYDSDETFKWFKYYYREKMIPNEVALPLLIQIYFASKVDQGFMNILARAAAAEPVEIREARLAEMKEEIAEWMDEDGNVILYRGYFEKPFGYAHDSSRPFEKAYVFTLDQEVARHYACDWFPQKAVVYTVKADPASILWCNTYSEEKTVIALPVVKGGKLDVLQEEIIPEDQYGSESQKRAAKQSYQAMFQ